MQFRQIPLRSLAAALVLALAAAAVPSLAADDVLDQANFDRSVKPTTDFYQFAVGGWRKRTAIPADQSSWGSFDEIQQRNELRIRELLESPDQTVATVGTERRKIGDFYAACTDVDNIDASGIGGLHPVLAAIEGAHSTADLAPLFADASGYDPNNTPGLGFGSEQDPKAATRVIAAVSQGGLTLPTRDYYLAADARSKEIRAAYASYLTRSFTLLGDDASSAANEAASIISIETALAKISKAPDELRDPFANYHPMTLASLESLAPGFGWKAYFAEDGVATASLGSIDVNQPTFVRGFSALMATVALPQWKSYLRWRAVDAADSALPRAFRDARFAFTKAVYGVKEQSPRWRTCVNATSGSLGFAVGKVYVAKYFPPAARARARAEIAEIRNALKADIGTVPWMSAQTRAAALAKLAKLNTAKVGYPDRWVDYAKLAIDSADYLGDVFAANRFAVERDLAKIGKPLDRTEWGLTPQTVNAYYDPSNNEIVIPAGILEKPFFDADADDAVNYGGIGAVIGHEMTHGYDDEGSDYDGDGNLHPMVTKADAARFHARVTCIIDQLDDYKTSIGLHLNGKLDAGEAAADLGGVTLAYRAMEASFAKSGHPAPLGGLTAEQRYYLSWAQVWRENARPQAERAQVLADVHPVSAYRVDGTLSDASNFDAAFGVKPGDAMYRAPAKRCAIW